MNSADLSALHTQALVVMDLFEGRSPSHSLSTADFIQATALASSLKQGLKAKVLSLSASFYALLLSPSRLASAYAQLNADIMKTGSPEVQFVWDFLGQRCSSPLAQPLLSLDPEEALALLLLELARSYDSAPWLTERTLRDFVAAGGGFTPLLARVLLVHKGHILGNPAAWLAERGLPSSTSGVEQTVVTAAPAAEQTHRPENHSRALQHLLSECQRLLDLPTSEPERQALQQLFRREVLVYLASLSGALTFSRALESYLMQHLPQIQARLLAARASLVFKRMLSYIRPFQDADWTQFENTFLTRPVQAVQAPAEPVLLRAQERSQAVENSDHLTSPTPEWKRLLRALTQGDTLSDLLQVALPPSLYAGLTQSLLYKLYTAFCLYSNQGFEAIRSQVLASLAPEELQQGRELLSQLERTCYRLAAWFKQDRSLGLPQALQRLQAEQSALQKYQSEPKPRAPQTESLGYGRLGEQVYGRYREQA
ncbi:MAG: hypothetical protein ACO1RX_01340 [Candidatus Sericytochromatia bacterium]